MLKQFLFLLSFLVAWPIFSQKDIYESNTFDALTDHHQILAVLPFLTSLNLDEGPGKEEANQLAQKEGYAVQNALETYFSKRKRKKKFDVDFQNTDDTNAILAQNGITYSNIDVYTTKELSKILKVDGIISGNLSLSILLSKGIETDFSFSDFFRGKTDYGRIGIKISDGSTGKLLWKYEREITKKTGKNTQELIEKMMKQASRKFPYDREKKRRKRRNKNG